MAMSTPSRAPSTINCCFPPARADFPFLHQFTKVSRIGTLFCRYCQRATSPPRKAIAPESASPHKLRLALMLFGHYGHNNGQHLSRDLRQDDPAYNCVSSPIIPTVTRLWAPFIRAFMRLWLYPFHVQPHFTELSETFWDVRVSL